MKHAGRTVMIAFAMIVMLVPGFGASVSAQESGLCTDALDAEPGDVIDRYTVVVGTGGPGNEIVIGTDGDDVLSGGPGDDVLCGYTGYDILEGDSGDDILVNGLGGGELDGGSGNDTLTGYSDDVLDGGAGDLDHVELVSEMPVGADCAKVQAASRNWTPDAYVPDARLRNCDLSGADLHESILVDADLRYANLSGADLHGAGLTGANLDSVFLTDANLRNAHLSSSNLMGADLTGADLTGANLYRSDLRMANLYNTIFSNTTCPDGVNSDYIGSTCEGHLTEYP